MRPTVFLRWALIVSLCVHRCDRTEFYIWCDQLENPCKVHRQQQFRVSWLRLHSTKRENWKPFYLVFVLISYNDVTVLIFIDFASRFLRVTKTIELSWNSAWKNLIKMLFNQVFDVPLGVRLVQKIPVYISPVWKLRWWYEHFKLYWTVSKWLIFFTAINKGTSSTFCFWHFYRMPVTIWLVSRRVLLKMSLTRTALHWSRQLIWTFRVSNTLGAAGSHLVCI